MMEKMNGLIKKINEADIAYYKFDDPIMNDREYDLLYNKLVALEQETGIILSGSPTQKVAGYVLETLEQVQHSRPMLSSNKTKSMDDIKRFIGERPAVASWKLDGLTLVLRYDNGRLTQAITRGAEGRIGEDVTHNVRFFKNVPIAISYKEAFEVRGEGVVSWSSFEKINSELDGEPYAHPRNFASGSVRKLEVDRTRNNFLEFFAFEMVSDREDNQSKFSQLAQLADMGFAVVHHLPIGSFSDEKQIDAAIKSFNPNLFNYPVDGVIVEYDDIGYGKSLGATGHHENRMLAFKWEDELVETTFLGLELATTRIGMVSLTGKFKDVKIGGTTVNRAYLHNLDIFDSFKLGIGDTVKIYKANQIIPQLAENITKSGTLAYPENCPCCGSELVVKKSEKGVRFLFCEEPSCPAKLVRKFVHFCSKTRMDIPGLSEKTLEKFVGAGWVTNFGDLYELERYREEFINTPGFGEKLFEKLQATINKRRTCTLNQLIAGLGIHLIGRTAGRTINQYFKGDWSSFENALQNSFDFTLLEDFGSAMNDSLYAWYRNEEEARLWRPLLKHLTFIKEERTVDMSNTNNVFAGKVVVATGKLNNYTRDGIQAKLISLGAKPASSISKKTDYLIVGSDAGKTKIDKAQELGIKTITESEFEDMACSEAS